MTEMAESPALRRHNRAVRALLRLHAAGRYQAANALWHRWRMWLVFRRDA